MGKLYVAKIENLNELENLLNAGKKHMDDQGISQWDSKYPSSCHLEKDIKNKEVYIQKGNNKIVSMATYSKEPFYEMKKDFSTIRYIKRVVTLPSEVGKGLTTKMLNNLFFKAKEEKINRIYISTSESNYIMQRVIEKTGFKKVNKKIISNRENIGYMYIYEKDIPLIQTEFDV